MNGLNGINIEAKELKELIGKLNGEECISYKGEILYIQQVSMQDCSIISRVFGHQFEERKLKKIFLYNCNKLTSLQNLPQQVEQLDIGSCDGLKDLTGLDLDNSKIEKIYLYNCTQLISISSLPKYVEELQIYNCGALQDISGIDIENGKLKKLIINGSYIIPFENQTLNINRLAIKDCTMISRVFGKQFQQGKLKKIFLYNCDKLRSLLNLPLQVEQLDIGSCDVLEDLTGIISDNSKIKKIFLYNCKQLMSISSLPKHIEELQVYNCGALQDLSGIVTKYSSIKRIYLFNCQKLIQNNWIILSNYNLFKSLLNFLKQIEELVIVQCNSPQCLNGIGIENGNLKKLVIYNQNILSVKDDTLNIENLAIKDCSIISRVFGHQFEERKLKKIFLYNCNKLTSLQNLPQQVKQIQIWNCEQINENCINSILETYGNNNIDIWNVILFKKKTCQAGFNKLQVFVWNINEKNLMNLENILRSNLAFNDLMLYQYRITSLNIKSCPLIKDLKGILFCNDISIENCESFNSLDGIDVLQNSKTITISECKKLSSLKGIQILNQMQKLDLHSNSIDSITPLEKFISLTELNLSDNQIEKINVLYNLANLQVINISKNKIKDINQLNGFQQLAKIRLFNCSGNQFCQNQFIVECLAYILPISIEQVFFGVEYNETNQVELLKMIQVVKNGDNPFTSKAQQKGQINVLELNANDVISSASDTYRIIYCMKKQQQSKIYKAYAQKKTQVAVMKIQENYKEMYKRQKQIIGLHHKSIVPILDTFSAQNNQVAIIMPLCKRIQDLFKNEIPMATLILFVVQVTEALLFLHNQQPKIIYRSINPNKIMFLQDNDVYKAVIAPPTIKISVDYNFINKVQNFQAPELIKRQQVVDERCDTYSLGKVIQLWFENFLNETESEVSQSILSMTDRMCSADPNKRPKLEHILRFLRNEEVDGEKQIMMLQHRNTIPEFYSLTTQNDKCKIIITPACYRLHEAFQTQINIETLILLATQVIKTLLYLHSQQPKIIYQNITPNNILLTPDNNTYKVVISIPTSNINNTMNCVQGFVAPELFDNAITEITDDRCDTYSLGKVILFWFENFLSEVEIQSEVSQNILKMIGRMCSANPNKRPKLEHVLMFFRNEISYEQVEDDERE